MKLVAAIAARLAPVALVLLVGPALSGCDEASSQPLQMQLRPGANGLLALTVDACDVEDELLSCYAEVIERGRLDATISSSGIRSSTECGAQLRVAVPEQTPAGSHQVVVEMFFTYWDHFFEEDRSGSEVVDVLVNVEEF